MENAIKYSTERSIPINKSIFNKYESVGEMFNFVTVNCEKSMRIDLIDFNLELKNTYIYHLAIDVFRRKHNSNVFFNNGNAIYVTNQDIKESINKICNDRMQNVFLRQHLSIFNNLGEIIEKSILVNQALEVKGRMKYITWNYYFNTFYIEDIKYNIIIDVVSRCDGQNHYRLHRIEKAETQSALLI